MGETMRGLVRLLQNRGHTVLSPGRLRVLAAVMDEYAQRGMALTVSDLCNRLQVQRSYIHAQLRLLRGLGLVQIVDGVARSILPTCRVEVIDQEPTSGGSTP